MVCTSRGETGRVLCSYPVHLRLTPLMSCSAAQITRLVDMFVLHRLLHVLTRENVDSPRKALNWQKMFDVG